MQTGKPDKKLCFREERDTSVKAVRKALPLFVYSSPAGQAPGWCAVSDNDEYKRTPGSAKALYYSIRFLFVNSLRDHLKRIDEKKQLRTFPAILSAFQPFRKQKIQSQTSETQHKAGVLNVKKHEISTIHSCHPLHGTAKYSMGVWQNDWPDLAG